MPDIKILCMLPICCYPTNTGSNRGEERIQQYVKGLVKFFEYNAILKKHNVDIYIVDNSIKDGDGLHADILAIIPENVKINMSLNNNFGCRNKGAGLIEQWRYCKDIIIQYDWLIHFEPRQKLLNFNFINDFLENPRNLFTLGNSKNHFNTGLFCIDSSKLLYYCHNTVLSIMVVSSISIEYDLFNYIKKNNILFYIRPKMELIWFDYTSNKSYFF
jgi:hypothetical protein